MGAFIVLYYELSGFSAAECCYCQITPELELEPEPVS